MASALAVTLNCARRHINSFVFLQAGRHRRLLGPSGLKTRLSERNEIMASESTHHPTSRMETRVTSGIEGSTTTPITALRRRPHRLTRMEPETLRIRRYALPASLAAVALVAGGVGIAAAQASGPAHYRFFEQQTSFALTSANGATVDPSKGAPQAGDRIEFTSLDYRGDHTHHAARWTATDHFVCVFDNQGSPICDGQVAIDNSMILIHGVGGEGNFSIPVRGGTGSFRSVRGELVVHNVGNTENSDIDITLR
jgi:hypothetical protein